jgi:quinol monooxygenase YgiN
VSDREVRPDQCKKIFESTDPFSGSGSSSEYRLRFAPFPAGGGVPEMAIAEQKPVTLVNVLSVEPERQGELVALLRQNTETIIKTLKGWISTSLVASRDGKRVVIYSQWDSAADIDAMRSDPRMRAYFPKIAELASLDTTVGVAAVSHHR